MKLALDVLIQHVVREISRRHFSQLRLQMLQAQLELVRSAGARERLAARRVLIERAAQQLEVQASRA
jgi:hypothetical protein